MQQLLLTATTAITTTTTTTVTTNCGEVATQLLKRINYIQILLALLNFKLFLKLHSSLQHKLEIYK